MTVPLPTSAEENSSAQEASASENLPKNDQLDSVDPIYEIDAPMYVDFSMVESANDEHADNWFERAESRSASDSCHKVSPLEVIIIEDSPLKSPKTPPNHEIIEILDDSPVRLEPVSKPGNMVSGKKTLKQPDHPKDTSGIIPKFSAMRLSSNPQIHKSIPCSGVEPKQKPTNTYCSRSVKKPLPSSSRSFGTFSYVTPAKSDRSDALVRSKSTTSTAPKVVSHGSQRPISAIKAKPQLQLTVPRTPDFLHRHIRRSQILSTEERELMEIQKARQALVQRRVVASESMKRVVSCVPSFPVRSVKPLTQPVEFKFRSSSHPTRPSTSCGEEIQSKKKCSPQLGSSRRMPLQRESNLSSHSLSAYRDRSTSATRSVEDGSSDKGSCKSGNNSSFRSKSVDLHPKLTQGKSPRLLTSARKRQPVFHKTFEERELEELEKIEKFKAKPLNPRIFESRGDYGVPRIKKKQVTEPKPLHFQTDERVKHRHESSKHPQDDLLSEKEKEPKKTFQPASLKTPINNLSSIRKPQLTVPRTPNFSTTRREFQRTQRITQSEKKPAQIKKRVVEAQPVPDFSKVFQPKLHHIHTEPKPFKVAEKGLHSHHSSLEVEQPSRIFRAQSVPNFDRPIGVPFKQVVPPTDPKPFRLETNARGEMAQMEWMKRVDEEFEEESKKFESFKAHPIPEGVYKSPFLPQRSTKPLTEAMPFNLLTEERSHVWSSLDEEKKLKESEQQMMEALRSEELATKEKSQVAELRRSLVVKANPIRKYRPVEMIGQADKPLTEPYSPVLQTKLRARNLRDL